MKKFIPRPSFPKTEEAEHVEQEKKSAKEEAAVSSEEKGNASSGSKWEKWGFIKKRKSEESVGEGEVSGSKKQKIADVVSGKSDVIISLDEKYARQIENQQKTYEFRAYKFSYEVKRMWIYVNKPVAKLLYIAEIDPAIEYPAKIVEGGLSDNKEFNEGAEWSKRYKFAYRIKHLYKINEPIERGKLKVYYGITPPQAFTYVSKYPSLAKKIIVNNQKQIY